MEVAMNLCQKAGFIVLVGVLFSSLFVSSGWTWSSDVIKGLRQKDAAACEQSYWRLYTVEGVAAIDLQKEANGQVSYVMSFCKDGTTRQAAPLR